MPAEPRQMRPIITVTLNPALDLSARIPEMRPGPKLRLRDPVQEPGGGGVNVARAIHALGGAVTAWVAYGGPTGALHEALLRAEGVAVHPFAAPGDTRQSWAVTDDSGAQYRLQLPGAGWCAQDGARALADILALADADKSGAAAGGGLVVLSGSQPPGLEDGFAADLTRALGVGRLLVDISGPSLVHLMQAPCPQTPPCLLRLDQSEAALQAGCDLPDIAAALDYARALQRRAVAQHVCIAHGADGSVLAGPEGLALHAAPPAVPVRSKVGAGDSFTGAFALALAQSGDPAEALAHGTAAAAAAVMTPGTQLCRAPDVARLRRDIVLNRLQA